MPQSLTESLIVPQPIVSVIIPTHNRATQLHACVSALELQTCSQEDFEIIVIDDGSTDETSALLAKHTRPNLRVIKQQNEGQVSALNRGIHVSRGSVLIFLDDDVVVPPHFISSIASAHRTHERAIILPVVEPACADTNSLFTRTVLEGRKTQRSAPEPYLGHFTELVGCCFSIKKQHLLTVGEFQTLPGKLWPDWNDVDFAYRAWRQGYEFWVYPTIIVYHFEAAVKSLKAACTRSRNAGYSAVSLFLRHPTLVQHLPMFRDKGPIAWGEDPPRLILRKVARHIASSRPTMWAMERSVPLLERHAPNSKLLALLYRWIISGYIYRGYRQGLREQRGGAA